MSSSLIPFKRIISRCRAACRRIHSPFQSAASSSERISPSTTGQPPSNKKRLLPKEEPQPAYIRKRTAPTPNRHTNQAAEAKRLPLSQNPAKVEMCGSPAAGRQTYKVACSDSPDSHESTLSALRLVRNSRSTSHAAGQPGPTWGSKIVKKAVGARVRRPPIYGV